LGFSRFTGALSSGDTGRYAKPNLEAIVVVRNCHGVDLPNYPATGHLFSLI